METNAHSYLICNGNESSRLRRAKEIGITHLFAEKVGESVRPFLNHPDVILVEPDPESKSAVISINQTRDLERKINLKPYSAEFKVVVIKEAQRMTNAAQNALLKILEEPPDHSVLVLTTPQASLLLPTIVSRCQRLILRPEVEINVQTEAHQSAVKDFFKLLEMGCGGRLSWIEDNKNLIGSQSSAVGLLDSWISVLRDFILVEGGLEIRILNEGFKGDLKKVRVSDSLSQLLEKAIEKRRILSTTNVNPRLAVETFLLGTELLP